MNYAVLYVVLACFSAALLVFFAFRRRTGAHGIENAQKLMAALDLEAFRNLVDPKEEAFLRASLPLQEFKKVKRERVWAAFEYVRALSQIALEFSRIGNALRQSPEPRQAKLGKELASGAIHLRLLTFAVKGRLVLAAAFPNSSQPSPQSLFEEYGRSSGLLIVYGLLERSRRQVVNEATV